MRNTEDFDPILRKEALESYYLILSVLDKIQGKTLEIRKYLPDFHTIDLEKEIPNENHKNLLLIFQSGSGGAKFSYREDKKFVITIYIQNAYNWERDIVKNIADWFRNRRSSFIHEFIHFLDIKETDNLESVSGVDLKDLQKYYNHPLEIRAHLQQALHELEWDLDHKYYKKDLLLRFFGSTKESFVSKVETTYFPYEFWKFVTKENKDKIRKAILRKYDEISQPLLEWIKEATDVITLEIMRKISNSKV